MPRVTRLLLWTALAAAVLWLLVTLAVWAAQERLIFLPDARPLAATRARLDPAGRFAVERVVTADGLALAFVAAAPAAPGNPVIVVFHGNAGNAADRIPFLGALAAGGGYGLVVAGYRGYGGNPGAPSEAGFIADARAHLDWTAARWPDSPVVLLGESIGSGVATRVAEERGEAIAALILDAPYTSVADLAAAQFPWLPVRVLLRHPFDSLSRLAAVRAPILVLHGEADTIIPAAHGRRIVAAVEGGRARGVFLPGAGHPTLYTDREGRALAALRAFLDTLPRGAVRTSP